MGFLKRVSSIVLVSSYITLKGGETASNPYPKHRDSAAQVTSTHISKVVAVGRLVDRRC